MNCPNLVHLERILYKGGEKMKKHIFAFFLALVFASAIPLSAQAVTPRAPAIQPGLSFNGTTATCSLFVSANSNDNITAVVKLWHGSRTLTTWNIRGQESINFIDTYSVSRNTTYKLTADVTINGTTYPQVSVSRTNS